MKRFVGILGDGAREHALAWRFRSECPDATIAFYPGNNFLATLGPCFSDFLDMVTVGNQHSDPLLVCGSENFAGYGDELDGWRFFGPNRLAAKLETSKVFAKQWMQTYGIPTAEVYSVIYEETELARFFSQKKTERVVMKYDSLVGGKGVAIVSTISQAQKFYAYVAKLTGSSFSGVFVLEECLEGVERSCFLVMDVAGHMQALPLAMDFKGKVAGGINTGGMGAFAPAPQVPGWENFCSQVLIPQIRLGLQDSGLQYPGVLYVGLMCTANGPYVLEFNVRFGDPEAQVIVPGLQTSLWQIANDACAGKLDYPIRWDGGHIYGAIVCATTDYGEITLDDHTSEYIPDAWFSACPWQGFWGKIRKDVQGRWEVQSGRVATLVYRCQRNSPSAEIMAMEAEALEWTLKHRWLRLHRRTDLAMLYCEQRRQYEDRISVDRRYQREYQRPIGD